MKIQLLSDLHLEVDPSFVARPAPDADLLVLAGDVGAHAAGSRLGAAHWDHAAQRLVLANGQLATFGLERFSPLRGWPVPVLYVPGNHEYDGLELFSTRTHLRQVCEELRILWLDQMEHLFAPDLIAARGHPSSENGTNRLRILGGTLWTDFDALGPQSDRPDALRDQLEARRKAFSAANWYLSKVGSTVRQADGTVLPLDAAELREQGLRCQAWLRTALATPHPDGPQGKTLVVTHFAPSLQSADPRYGLTPGTAGFCNSLDELVTQADLWLHGHLHCPSDYRVGRCRVVANPLGYANKQEQVRFQAQAVIEI
jgi:predicted phosphodiesterase